jgi:[protein-PII] uridylyltransferase
MQRERLYARLQEHPIAGVRRQAVDFHFARMPARYWERVTKTELIWGLETVHAFSEKTEAAQPARNTVVADSRHYPERGFTKVMICAWDAPGLLAKIAAAFSALRVNIRRADVYTRADHLVLDLFEVSELDHGNLSAEKLSHLVFLLEGSLSQPPRFASIWASELSSVIPRAKKAHLRIEFDNNASTEQTLIQVQTIDRLGLLHDILKAIADCGLNVVEALIETDEELASDGFYVTDLAGKQILDPERIENIRNHLVEALRA